MPNRRSPRYAARSRALRSSTSGCLEWTVTGFSRELRSAYHGEVALVALTGYGSAEDARRAKDAGFVQHLTKPVEVSELAAIVSRAVS